jgi:putative transposase
VLAHLHLLPTLQHLKDTVAPWHPNVTQYAWDTGIRNARAARAIFSASKSGQRARNPVGFPRSPGRYSKVSITFTEIAKQLGWLADDRHDVRLVLPRGPTDPLVTHHREDLRWIHATVSTRRLYNQVRDEKARVQYVTLSFIGGRRQAAFMVRYRVAPTPRTVKHQGDVVDVDLGVRHLATLSLVVADLTDEFGHVKNLRHFDALAGKLAKIDRAIARGEQRSKNRVTLERRRARLHGQMKRTRDLELHHLTSFLARSFDAVVLEDLAVTSMTKRVVGDGRNWATAQCPRRRRWRVASPAHLQGR